MALKRVHNRRKQRRGGGPLPFRYVLLISSVIFIFLTIQGLYFVDQHVRPALMTIATIETQRISNQAIHQAVSGDLTEQDHLDDLVLMERTEDGDISSLAFDAAVYNQVLEEAIDRIHSFLDEVEAGMTNGDVPAELEEELEDADADGTEDGAIYNIPLGMATNNALLAQLGPQVPVSFSAVGDPHVDMEERVENVGINNTWLRISLSIEMDIRVVIPFGTEEDTMTTTVPVGMVFVPGDVPDYYGEGGGMPIPAITPSGDEEGVEMQDPDAEIEEMPGDEEDATN
ncbi:sporulation protein YunB [Natribacillus halophilus]|uniref:Sporulation protein YunB n=1 Tax=Natribacillus halophilus TaxID=549003 RepID=A0A1G8RME3_9BACI|nr:sporulation protein YunB [Natribacillus halophilus]SDJ18244.1 sporulation protein YunB [Natribacillus halophilus]